MNEVISSRSTLSRHGRTELVYCLLGCSLAAALMVGNKAVAQVANPLALSERTAYLVEVPLPIVGDRDANVRRQISQIAQSSAKSKERPIVVLAFRATPTTEEKSAADSMDGLQSRGSEFGRCLELARTLTSESASRVRLVAYLPNNVEGHAVLPVLACEEILCAPFAELGRAAIDDGKVGEGDKGFYLEKVNQRRTLPAAVVMSMLNPGQSIHKVNTVDNETLFIDQKELAELQKAGKVVSEDTLWPGGSLASYSGQTMREQGWITRTISDPSELSAALGISGTLRKARKMPDEWHPVQLTVSSRLTSSRVNQIIRSIGEYVRDDKVNLLVLRMETSEASFQEASRLASYLADLDSSKFFTVGLIATELVGPAALVPLACDEAILLSGGSLAPEDRAGLSTSLSSRAVQLVLANLESESNRPASLLSALIDRNIVVKEYIEQDSGRRAVFAEWQLAGLPNANKWLAKEAVAGGQAIPQAVALKYGLVDSTAENATLALNRLGMENVPTELKMPWLDAGIQRILAQGWLPRVLLMLGFFALMAELGSPGVGIGGFTAALCFLGFFWIEGLNGNVEWLEVILFVAGLVSLGIELFILPGFGLFGIGGLLMLLVSIVLASQTFVWPSTSAQLEEFSMNLFWVACLALGGMIGILVMHKQLERLPILRWVTLQPAGAVDLDELEARESVVHWEYLLGQEGVTTTRLNPSGKAQFGRDIVAVVGSGRMVDEGVPVRVVEVRGNMVIVEVNE
jgi:membrane-bound serine protease (ClpP class)